MTWHEHDLFIFTQNHKDKYVRLGQHDYRRYVSQGKFVKSKGRIKSYKYQAYHWQFYMAALNYLTIKYTHLKGQGRMVISCYFASSNPLNYSGTNYVSIIMRRCTTWIAPKHPGIKYSLLHNKKLIPFEDKYLLI